jgi:hypothetical protein
LRDGDAALLQAAARSVSRRAASSSVFAVGEHPLDRLEIADGLAELLALLGVVDGLLERGRRDADRLRRDADAPAVERHHRDLEALVLSRRSSASAGTRSRRT